MTDMESLDLWRLCDEVCVIQAVLLIIGQDPSYYQNIEQTSAEYTPEGYHAVFTAVTNAILSKKLPATIRRSAWVRGWDEEPGQSEEYATDVTMFPDQDVPNDEQRYIRSRRVIYRASPDWRLTTVKVDDLRAWLIRRGVHKGFFFPNETASDAPEYLNPKHPRYAPKLAAAVSAWIATGDETITRGRSAKQALAKWLRENATKFGLTDEEGRANETGIEESAKVANWQPGGGVPKTPGNEPAPLSNQG